MPRRASDTVQTHRIEMGVWEREQVEPILNGLAVASYGVAAGSVIAAAGIGLAGVAAFYTLRALYQWGGELKETIEETG